MTKFPGEIDTGANLKARDLEVQLSEERARVSNLEKSLEQTKTTLASLQTTCSQQEKELKQSSQAAEITQSK